MGGAIGANSPSLDDVARYLGVTPRRLIQARLTQNEQNIYLRLGDLFLADEPAPAEDLVINEDRALVHAALQRLSPFEAWVICERFGLGEPTSDRRIRGTARGSDPADERHRTTPPSGSGAEEKDHESRPTDSYFQRSYFEMGEDCGLSVHRIRQVERTALDKLRVSGPTNSRANLKRVLIHSLCCADFGCEGQSIILRRLASGAFTGQHGRPCVSVAA